MQPDQKSMAVGVEAAGHSVSTARKKRKVH